MGTMNKTNEPLRTTEPLPAGQYWLGDPCYIVQTPGAERHSIEDREWHEWLDAAWKDWEGPTGSVPRIMDAAVRGHRIVASGTAFGDGVYDSNHGGSYPVDAGLIGVVPAELYPEATPQDPPYGMTLEEFDEPFHVEYVQGTIIIGGISVYTEDWSDE